MNVFRRVSEIKKKIARTIVSRRGSKIHMHIVSTIIFRRIFEKQVKINNLRAKFSPGPGPDEKLLLKLLI